MTRVQYKSSSIRAIRQDGKPIYPWRAKKKKIEFIKMFLKMIYLNNFTKIYHNYHFLHQLMLSASSNKNRTYTYNR